MTAAVVVDISFFKLKILKALVKLTFAEVVEFFQLKLLLDI